MRSRPRRSPRSTPPHAAPTVRHECMPSCDWASGSGPAANVPPGSCAVRGCRVCSGGDADARSPIRGPIHIQTWSTGGFTAGVPDRLWCMDVTQHRTGEGWVYCAVVLDAFSRRIAGWSIADHLRAELVCDALDMARWRRRPPAGQTIAHSDHGAQYTSWAFGQRIRTAGLLGSMGTIGDCFHNSMVERKVRSNTDYSMKILPANRPTAHYPNPPEPLPRSSPVAATRATRTLARVRQKLGQVIRRSTSEIAGTGRWPARLISPEL